MAFTFVTITHTFETAADVPATGTVDFTPIAPMHNGPTVVKKAVTATLSGSGGITQLLAANTDPDTTPTGTTYQVTERITGQTTVTYYVQVPHDQGTILDLRELAGWEGATAGSGTVVSINGEGPDGSGDITLSAPDVGAQPADGDLTGLAALGDGVPRRASGTWGLVTGTPDGTKFLRDDGTWASASGSSYTDEQVRDVIGAALVAGPNVTITPDDPGNTITIQAATTGASGIPASTVTTKGDLIVATGNAAVNRKSVGTDGQALLADSAQTTGVAWGAPTPADSSVTNAKVATGAAISADKTADGTTNKVFTATEKTKLAGIATGATAYDNEQAQDAAASLFTTATHSGISFSYNDAAGTLAATVTGGGGGSGVGLSGSNVVSLGADPTGSASSTTAFQNAINAGDVLIPAGTYKVGKVTYTGSTGRRIIALGPVRIIQTSGLGVFDLKGGWDLIGTVSSYANAVVNLPYPGEPTPGSTTSMTTALTMSSAVTLAFGDIVKIVSDDQIVSAPSSNSRRGEYAVIPKPVSSSTTVPLSNALIETYTTNVRLARLWNVRFEISGPIIFDVDSSIADATNSEPVIYLKAAQYCYVGGGVEFHNSIGRALSNFAYATHVDGVRFRGQMNRPTFSQYGYGLEDCGWQTRMTGCVGENLRHLYTDNDGDTTAGSTVFESFGGGWFAHVSDCVAFGTSASSFDTHGTAYGTVFADCRAYGTYVGADTGGTGFSARGRKITFMNCVADQCYHGFQTKADDTTFINCRAQKAMGVAFEVSRDTGSSLTSLKATVVGGLYESAGNDEYANAYLGTSGTTCNIEIIGARFRKLTAPTNGLRMFELAPNVNLKFTDLTIDWENYVRSTGDELINFWLTGASITVLGRRLYNLGGSNAAGSFTMFKSSTGAADSTPIEVYDVDHRHSSLAATVLDGPLTAGRHSSRSLAGSTRTGSNDLTMVAAASAVLPIADKLDPVVAVRLTGTGGSLSLAAIPTTGAIPGQVLHVVNTSNGTVTVNSKAIAAAATGTFVYLQGSWRTLS